MAGAFASVQFQENSSAGSGTFVNIGGSTAAATGGFTLFSYNGTAGQATISNKAADANGAEGGLTIFYDSSKAADATITSDGSSVSGAGGGFTEFMDRSDAGGALLIANGGSSGGTGGIIHFFEFSTANNATLIANGGSNGGGGGSVLLEGAARGETARVAVFGNGNLNLVARTVEDITIGSLEGDGSVLLSAALSVGSNSLDTTFSGIIQDVGSLTKIGAGTLTLSGANTYSGGTTVTDGALLVNRSGASGTGTGAVQVNAGTLGGNRIIAGAVTIGTGSGAGAFLAPGKSATRLITLRIQGTVTLKADATYSCRLSTSKATTDQVVARGVTIENGAQFKFRQLGNRELTVGTLFTVASNTSTDLFGGTFANLPDNSTFTAGRNKFQVSYEGGDGNDMTLTVIP
jgi:autotransporter-associated beta strand protein